MHAVRSSLPRRLFHPVAAFYGCKNRPKIWRDSGLRHKQIFKSLKFWRWIQMTPGPRLGPLYIVVSTSVRTNEGRGAERREQSQCRKRWSCLPIPLVQLASDSFGQRLRSVFK